MNLLFIISAALSTWSATKLHFIKEKADISTVDNAQTQDRVPPK